MLVDVLGALYAGRAAIEDTARVIGDLAAALSDGSNAFLRTVAASVVRAGRLKSCRGSSRARTQPAAVLRGDVPASMPPDGFWSDRFFELPVFKPPPIDPNGATGIPHLNLDQVLDDVIGDLL